MTAQAAITAAINAKFQSPPVVTIQQAKATTKDHILVFVARRYVPERRASGEVTIPGSRVVVRCICKTDVGLDVFRTRVAAALEDQILTGDHGPFVFESEDFVDPDMVAGADWYIAESTWTF